MTRRVANLVLLGMLAAPVAADTPEAPPPEIAGVRVGLAGHYKAGLWTPVEVTLGGGDRSSGGKVILTVPDGDGVPSRVWMPAREDQTSVLLYARFGRVASELAVQLRAGGRVVAQKTFEAGAVGENVNFPPAVSSNRKIIVTVGSLSEGVQEAVDLLRQEADGRPVVVKLDDLGQLPTRWYGYEAVDTVVLSTSRPKIYSDLKPNDPRIAALAEWIELGGKLVLCVGQGGQEILGDGSPLARFAPGQFEEMVPLRRTGALEAYSDSSEPVPLPAGRRRHEIRVPRLADVEGIIEVGQRELPLVVRTPRGFGQVVFVAADLDRGPLGKWLDRGKLLGKLLGLPMERSEESAHGSAMMHYGYTNMAGQLRSALDRFTDVRLVPFWLVATLVVVYILLIGPADYFFLRHLARRMRWTWVTFPLIVAVFSVGAYLLAYRLKRDQLRVNQADLVDVDMASGRARGTSWINVFSPRLESFNLSLQPKLPDGAVPRDPAVLIAWLGLPGGALGGMDPRSCGPGVWTEPYDFSPQLDKLVGVPIQVWSTKSLTARWNAPAGACPEAELSDEAGVPTGTITNTLDVPLSDCMLAYGHWAFELGTLRPNQSVDLDAMTTRTSLKSVLTQRKAVYDESGNVRLKAAPYDQSSVEVPYILRIMMFFEAVGARRYTGLSNEYQHFVDFSGLLKTGRAVLVGHAARRGAEWLRDGHPIAQRKDPHVTVYRFVFPVKTR